MFNSIYFDREDIYELQKKYPNNETKNIHFVDSQQEIKDLTALVLYKEHNSKFTVNLIAVENRDPSGVNLYMDCFKIINLETDSEKRMWLNVSFLVKRVDECRNNNIDLQNLTII